MLSERFYGMGEPLIQREGDTGVMAAEYLDLVKALGCTAYRSWMHLTDTLKDPHTPNEEVCEAHRRLLRRAAQLDLEVTGMSHEWFLPEGCKQQKGHAMPGRDLTEGSLYMQALHMLEESWCTQAKLFPEVGNWEVGNEWNLNAFLHPDGFLDEENGVPFTAEEKMDIAIDLMYFSARGVRKGNPKAKVTCFSPALSTPWLGGDLPDYLPPMYGIAWTLDKMYRRIKSGKFWSENTDDYFDMLSWHPYQMSVDQSKVGMELFLDIFEPDHLWKDYNDAAYRVMCKYGDGHKQVILTEAGFTDCGDEEEETRRAGYTRKLLELAAQLPYVRTVYNFRLLNEEGMLKKAGIEDNQIGWTMATIVVGIIIVASALICVCGTKERTGAQAQAAGGEKKKDEVSTGKALKSLFTNRYWLSMIFAMFVIFFIIVMYSAGAIFYCADVLGNYDLYTPVNNALSIAQFATMFFTPFFMKKFGKHMTYMVGLVGMGLGFLGTGFAGTNVALLVLFNALKGIGLGAAGGMAFGMVADTLEYGEWKDGFKSVGMGNAAISAAQKLGLGIGQVVLGVILDIGGYEGAAAVQSESAKAAISFIYNWLPVGMIVVTFIIMLTYKLDKELPKIQKELEERHK